MISSVSNSFKIWFKSFIIKYMKEKFAYENVRKYGMILLGVENEK